VNHQDHQKQRFSSHLLRNSSLNHCLAFDAPSDPPILGINLYAHHLTIFDGSFGLFGILIFKEASPMGISYTLSIGKCVLPADDCVCGYACHNTIFGSFRLSNFISGCGFGRYTTFIDVCFKISTIAFFDEGNALFVV